MTVYQPLNNDFDCDFALLFELKLKNPNEAQNLTDNQKAALTAANAAVTAVRGQIPDILNKYTNPNDNSIYSLTEHDKIALANCMRAIVNAYQAVVNTDNENAEAAAEAIKKLEKHADSAHGSRAIRVLGTAMNVLSLALAAVAVVSLALGVISAFTGVLALPAFPLFVVALSSFGGCWLADLLSAYSLSYLDPVGKSMDKLGSALNKLKPKQPEAENTSCGGKFARLFFDTVPTVTREAAILRNTLFNSYKIRTAKGIM